MDFSPAPTTAARPSGSQKSRMCGWLMPSGELLIAEGDMGHFPKHQKERPQKFDVMVGRRAPRMAALLYSGKSI